jgi:hypothetical protein
MPDGTRLEIRTAFCSVAGWVNVEVATNEFNEHTDLDVSHPGILPGTPRSAFMRFQHRTLSVQANMQVSGLVFWELSASDLDIDVP